MDTIKSQLGDDVIENISKQLGEGTDSVKTAIEKLLPTIMSGVNNKVSGDTSFLSKFDADKDGDVDLDDVKGFFGGATSNASKTVTDLLGDKKEAVEETVAAESGISKENAASLTERLTSFVMNNLNSTKLTEGATSITDSIKKEVEGFKTGEGSGMAKNLMGMLDGDNDGDVDMDDLKKIGGNLLGRFRK